MTLSQIILKAVAKHTQTTTKELQSKKRNKKLTTARAIYYYLCQEHKIKTQQTAQTINRTHPTVIATARAYTIPINDPTTPIHKLYKQTLQTINSTKII